MKFASKDTTVVVKDGRRHFVTVTVTTVEPGEPILHVLLWASGEDITRQLTEAQRRALAKEFFQS